MRFKLSLLAATLLVAALSALTPNVAHSQTPLWGVSNAGYVSAESASQSQGVQPTVYGAHISKQNDYAGQLSKDISLFVTKMVNPIPELNYTVTSQVFSRAEMGIGKVYGQVTNTWSGSSAPSYSRGSTGWFDVIVFPASSIPTNGIISTRLTSSIEGSVSGDYYTNSLPKYSVNTYSQLGFLNPGGGFVGSNTNSDLINSNSNYASLKTFDLDIDLNSSLFNTYRKLDGSYALPIAGYFDTWIYSLSNATGDFSHTTRYNLDILTPGVTYTSVSGFSYASVAAPEPTTLSLALLGISGLIMRRKRRDLR
jgi:hypothetical protein